MFKVLLVDDEEWVVQSLKHSINWEEFGFQIIGEANSGDEALDFIETNKPHLVITDIKMPGMNGLELIKKVISKDSAVQFVVASGHAEFVYAQKALRYGAIGYCLKPFEEHEIGECLVKARLNLEARRKNDDLEFIDLLFGQSEPDYEKVKGILHSEGVQADRNEMAVIQILDKKLVPLEVKVPFCSLKTGPRKMVFVINQSDFQAFMETVKSFPHSGAGYSTNIKLHELKDAVQAANISAFHHFVTGSKDCYHIVPTSTNFRGYLSDMADAMAKKDLKLIDYAFQELTHCFAGGQCTVKDAYWVYCQIVYYANDRLAMQIEVEIDNFEQLCSVYMNVNDMLADLGRQVNQHIISFTQAVHMEIEHQTIREIAQYVNENFYKDINLSEISKLFYVTPNYVSYLFKKEMGVNFTEYISKLRIDYAGTLLHNANLTIQQVSEKSGFNDYFYFTRIFKKVTGLTPSEFKKKNK
ncbi:DNA-binding response regulator [Paenibacillus marchantiophytorum]|uniref:DNA-binding response regulator n=1 Tax=Paenibacillus marchantiophytorum TaxID=1619310 RepID=A0ABQ1EQU8_9BACL|nr:response regulator [Paenibacillus marchantiophytorum]GFZ83117.1 DNA-binding response regulator [Paenibacillus marchantiophytorum]